MIEFLFNTQHILQRFTSCSPTVLVLCKVLALYQLFHFQEKLSPALITLLDTAHTLHCMDKGFAKLFEAAGLSLSFSLHFKLIVLIQRSRLYYCIMLYPTWGIRHWSAYISIFIRESISS